jgi:hypothetical protein
VVREAEDGGKSLIFDIREIFISNYLVLAPITIRRAGGRSNATLNIKLCIHKKKKIIHTYTHANTPPK